MGLNANSLATGVGVGVKNKQFSPSAGVLQRNIGIVGTYDPSITTIANDEAVLITSPEDAGDRFGFGFMIHRLAVETFKGSRGIPTYVIPQAQVAGSQAVGNVGFGGTSTAPGTVSLYVGGDRVGSPVAATGLTAAQVAAAVVVEFGKIKELPVTAAVDGVDNTQVNFTAKTTGTYGNEIKIAFNLSAGEELPPGITAVITQPTGGSGTPNISTALNSGLGTGDNANDLGITDLVHGYLLDTSTLNAIQSYVGEGDEFSGLYSKTVGRPFRALTGDITPGSSGLNALLAISGARLNDRANGVIAAPGSESHPSEIAAQAIGHMARINNNRAEETYEGTALSGIWPGSDQWTSSYDNRDIAVKSGLSPTFVKSGTLVLQDVLSFYRPSSIPVASNGYRLMRNISITQNIKAVIRQNFESERWRGITIVNDVSAVGNASSKEKARDVSSVIDDLVALALEFEKRAWIFDSAFTIDSLQDPSAVTIRAGGSGFDINLKVVYSGAGGIVDTLVEFDTSIAVAL